MVAGILALAVAGLAAKVIAQRPAPPDARHPRLDPACRRTRISYRRAQRGSRRDLTGWNARRVHRPARARDPTCSGCARCPTPGRALSPGTENAERPFWSPDGRYIGFFARPHAEEGRRQRRPGLQRSAEVSETPRRDLEPDGIILFTPDARGPVYRISANGGTPVAATTLTRKDATHRCPRFLPDGKHFLYLVRHSGAGRESPRDPRRCPRLEGSEDRSRTSRRMPCYASGRVLSSSREGGLVAQRFDLGRLAAEGEPVVVEPDVLMDERFSRGVFTASDNGILAYQTGTGSTTSLLRWVDREGRVLGTVGEPAEYFTAGTSRSRRTARRPACPSWICDGHGRRLDHRSRLGDPDRFTAATGDKYASTWSPDGKHIAFAASNERGYDIIVRATDGSSQKTVANNPVDNQVPTGFSPDGRFVLITKREKRREDVLTLALDGGANPPPVGATPSSENLGQVSPNGRYVAYMSDESGRFDVYVTTFPQPGSRWQVSQERRSRASLVPKDGKELFFFGPDNRSGGGRGPDRHAELRGRRAPSAVPVASVRDRISLRRLPGRQEVSRALRSAAGALADHAGDELDPAAGEEVTLAAGSRLGPYEILSPLGAGGMGEVYKAKDTRLERTVAVKVLPSHLSASPEVRQRFEREAKTISQLSHPHICALYDVGREGETEYLVMEYLEGETLTDRLSKGALSLDQTLRFGSQIADALDKAHRQGIVHRDLKPGNVMLTKSGVKLLDFGLAKAMAPAGAADRRSRRCRRSTVLTQEGHDPRHVPVHGAGAARGQGGRRSDGPLRIRLRPLRDGDGEESVLGVEPGVAHHGDHVERSGADLPVQPMSPPALDRVVKTCLAKDPEDRWQSAADVKREIQWIGEGSAAGIAAPAAVVGRRRRREGLAWGLAAAGLVAAAVAFVARRPVPAASPLQLNLAPPPGLRSVAREQLAVSPDGRRLLFIAEVGDGRGRLWVQSLDTSKVRRLEGTELARYPFWSPDGRTIAFFQSGRLRRIDADGGAIQTISEEGGSGFGGSWNAKGEIVFCATYGAPLLRVSAAGGTPKPATALDAKRGDAAHLFPSFLPDGRRFTFAARNVDPRKTSVALGDLDAGASAGRVLFQADSSAVWGPPGYLLFAREGTLFAQRVRRGRRAAPEGDPAAVTGNIRFLTDANRVEASAGADLLVYGLWPHDRRLVWVDRQGRETGTLGPVADYEDVRISPAGDRVAVSISKSGGELESRRLGRRRRPRRRLPSLDRAVRRVPSRLDSRRPEADLCVGSRRLLRSLREARWRRARNRGDPDGLGQAGRAGSPRTARAWSSAGRRRERTRMSGSWLWTGTGLRDPSSRRRSSGSFLAAFAGRPMDRLHIQRVRPARSLRGAVSVGAQAAVSNSGGDGPGLEPGRKGNLLRRPRRPPLRGPGEFRRRESGNRGAAAALRPGFGPGQPVRSGYLRRECRRALPHRAEHGRIVGRPGRGRRRLDRAARKNAGKGKGSP